MALVVPNPDRDNRPAADGGPDTAAAADEPTAAAPPTENIRTRSKRTATPTDAIPDPAAASALAATTAPWRMDVGRSISAAALAGFRWPAIEAVRQIQLGITEQFRAPIAIAPIKTMVERALGPAFGPASWMGKQDSLWRAAIGPAWSFPAMFPTEPWWTETTLWPTDGLVASLFRPLDVVRPRLLDLSRTMDNLLGATNWIGLNEGLWRELSGAGQRIIFWAVLGARAALERNDMEDLEDFVRDWLGTAPTPPRMEALVEALLQIDLESYAPHEGEQLLRDLRRRVAKLHAQRRAEHETLLGMRRGAGPIARLGNIDLTAFRLPGLPGSMSLENHVLDRVQPDVDPRLIEKIKTLPPEDQKIVVIKAVTGCAWSAAATACGRPARHGEAVRRRTHRWRKQLTPSTDPWAELPTVANGQRDSFGRIQPATILASIPGSMTNAVEVRS